MSTDAIRFFAATDVGCVREHNEDNFLVDKKLSLFMVADGMSHGTLTLSDLAIRKSTGQRCAWMRLWDRPGTRRALQDTASADSIVTDSSAASSCYGGV